MEIISGQFRRMGMAHDRRRAVATIDPGYYRWTQWIFTTIYESWYDDRADAPGRSHELIDAYASGDAADAGRPPVDRADARPSSGRRWTDAGWRTCPTPR